MSKSFVAAVAAACVLTTGCGGDDGDTSSGGFDGEEAKVAAVIDQLGKAAREGDVTTICEDLITVDLQRTVRQESGSSCGAEFRENIVSEQTAYEVRTVEVDGESATAEITDQEDRSSEVSFVKVGDAWRIARIR